MNDQIIPGFDKEKDEGLLIELQNFSDTNDSIALHLEGYIDTKNTILFQKRVKKVIDAGYINLIFNCTKFSYLSSTGVGSFTEFLKAVKPMGGKIILVNLQPKVYEIFELLGFLHMFILKKSIAEAVDFLENSMEDKTLFPMVFNCPVCSKKLQAEKTGKFRCSKCKSGINVGELGQVTLA